MYNKRIKIRSVGELKKLLETVSDDAKVYACGGSTEDGAVWGFVGENCISLDERSLDDEFFDRYAENDEEEYETLYEKEAYYDEGGARFCLIAEGAGNSLPCEINNDIDEFNFQFIQRLFDVVQTDTGAYLTDLHSLEQVAAEISDSEIEQMIKYAEWDFDGCDKVSRESIVYWYALLLLDSTPSSDEDPIAIFRDELYQFLDNISFNTNNVYKGE